MNRGEAVRYNMKGIARIAPASAARDDPIAIAADVVARLATTAGHPKTAMMTML